ncbi:MAG TPA: GNAT family N-acetyltransferase [Candidatus Limnocylindria bacterium]|nr:GNAT family N-acetyltransferase [Candidatus Limnocylindria bacterium]
MSEVEDSGRRFAVRVEGKVARLWYRLDGDRLVLEHTIVPEALSGRGLAGRLVQSALDRARRDGLSIVPECEFASAWLRRHPEAASGVRLEWPGDDS